MKTTVSTSEKTPGSPFRSRGRNPFGIQAKLLVNTPGDTHEAEADRAADRVVDGPGHASAGPVQLKEESDELVQQKPIAQTVTPYIQRKADDQMGEADIRGIEDKMAATGHEAVQRKEEDEPAQMKAEDEGIQLKAEDEPAQMKEEDESAQLKEDEDAQMKEDEDVQARRFDEAPAAATDISSTLKSSKGQGSPLPTDVRTKMESGFGADFSDVKVHTGSNAVGMSKSLGAKAFTNKGDIYFNEGKFNPASREGEFLLAHELTHTLQQGAAKPKTEEEAAEPEEQEASSPEKEGSPLKPASKKGKADTGEEPPSPGSPKEDRAFVKTLKYLKKTAVQETVHPDPKVKKGQVEAASALPAAEQERANDEAAHIEGMDQTAKERKPFLPSTFKTMLQTNLTKLESDLPDDKASAKNFKEKKPIDQVKKNIGGQVASENARISGPLAAQAQGEAPKSGAPVKEATELKEDTAGAAPEPINPKAVVPKPKRAGEISMQEESDSLDDYMRENNLTETQLARSNEPAFLTALDAKKSAQQKAAEVPRDYRRKENARLKGASTEADTAGKQALTAMHGGRTGSFAKVFGKQQETEKTDEQKKAEIDAQLNGIYIRTQASVKSNLEALGTQVRDILDKDAEAAKKTFETNVEKGLDAIYGWTTADDYIFGEDTGAINELFREEKEIFVRAMDAAIDRIAVIIADTLNNTMSIIDKGLEDSEKYIAGLDKSWQELGDESLKMFTGQYEDLEESVNEAEKELAEDLARAYKENIGSLEETFNTLKEEASSGWLDGAWNAIKGVVDTIRQLKEIITSLLSAISGVLSVILEDPLDFVGKLFEGIGSGLDQFMGKIQEHLLTSLPEWLMGSLGSLGIVMPKDIFSLNGIFNLTLQVLDRGWDYIRQKAVDMLGEPAVKGLEESDDVFKTFASQGIEGIWEYLKDQFTDLKETVIEPIKDMLIMEAIGAGIKWLAGLLIPGGGFVKALMALKDLIVFVVESAIVLIPVITEAILALAAGNVAGVAIATKEGLSKMILVVIRLFTRFFGLGDLNKKVMKIFTKIRKRIDRQIKSILTAAKKKAGVIFGPPRKAIGGKKNEVVNNPDKQKKINKGLADLDKEEKKYLSGGKISREGAEKVAKTIKRNNSVFKKFIVVDGEQRWNYKYAASPVVTIEGERKDEDNKDVNALAKVAKEKLEKISETLLGLDEGVKDPYTEALKKLNDRQAENVEFINLINDVESKEIVISEFKEIIEECYKLQKEIKRILKQSESQGSGRVTTEMQGYNFEDVKVKGPHANVKVDGRKATEAQIALENGKLTWKRLADMEGISHKQMAQAQRTIDKLLDDKNIMKEARIQTEKLIADFKDVLKDPKSSKKLRGIAKRGIEKYGTILKLFKS